MKRILTVAAILQLHHYLTAREHYLDSIMSADEQGVQRKLDYQRKLRPQFSKHLSFACSFTLHLPRCTNSNVSLGPSYLPLSKGVSSPNSVKSWNITCSGFLSKSIL